MSRACSSNPDIQTKCRHEPLDSRIKLFDFKLSTSQQKSTPDQTACQGENQSQAKTTKMVTPRSGRQRTILGRVDQFVATHPVPAKLTSSRWRKAGDHSRADRVERRGTNAMTSSSSSAKLLQLGQFAVYLHRNKNESRRSPSDSRYKTDDSGAGQAQGRNQLNHLRPRRQTIILEAHDKLGHKGFYSTHRTLLDRFWWPNIAHDVKQHISTCHECQIRQTTKIRIPPVVASPAPLFRKAYIDTMLMPHAAG